MVKKLEEIFWEKNRFKNSVGKSVNAIPVGEPAPIGIGLDDEEDKKIIKEFVETNRNYNRLKINAYSKGDIKKDMMPVQFYKI